jgi:phage terminase small subunit
MKHNNLTLKQEAFAQAYVKSGDASEAYREVYSYNNMKPATINRKAHDVLKNGKVSARIEVLKEKISKIAEKKFNITHEEILNHLNILRNARIDEYIEYVEVSTPITRTSGSGKNKVTETVTETRTELRFKTFDKLTKEQLMCIESIKQDRYGKIEIKLHGKEWTIEKINKHIGFYQKDNEQSKPETIINWHEERTYVEPKKEVENEE